MTRDRLELSLRNILFSKRDSERDAFAITLLRITRAERRFAVKREPVVTYAARFVSAALDEPATERR